MEGAPIEWVCDSLMCNIMDNIGFGHRYIRFIRFKKKKNNFLIGKRVNFYLCE